MSSKLNSAYILDNLSTAVFVLSEDFSVIEYNPAAEMLLQVSQKRIETSTLEELFLDFDQSLIEEMREIMVAGHTYTQREGDLCLINGDHILVDCTISSISAPKGQTKACLLVEMQARDRLMRISREEQLHENQETARILVRGLAHEIKNPLGGIRGAAQLLETEISGEHSEYTQVIIDEVDRLRSLVDRMLGTHKALNLNPLNVHEILERVCSLILAESGKSIKVIKDYDPSIPEIMGDKSQLIQGFLNIAKNALQALEAQIQRGEAASICIRTRTLRQFTIGQKRHRLVARIELIDNGPGIDRSLIQNIFYPMISGRAEGTGLGLSITQSIFTKHNGLVECESQPGHTNFIVYLPLELEQ